MVGCAVALSQIISQVMGSIEEQSSPSAQQRTVVLSAKALHDVPIGQQKLLGRPLSHCVVLVGHISLVVRRQS